MRTQRQIVIYPSILEVLLEQGCPFCRFLKEYQTAHLQLHTEQHIHHLCSFHTWGLAAVQNGLTAAQVFMYPVVEPIPFPAMLAPVTLAGRCLREKTGEFLNSSAASIEQMWLIRCGQLRYCVFRAG
jgi:hypothetical protein